MPDINSAKVFYSKRVTRSTSQGNASSPPTTLVAETEKASGTEIVLRTGSTTNGYYQMLRKKLYVRPTNLVYTRIREMFSAGNVFNSRRNLTWGDSSSSTVTGNLRGTAYEHSAPSMSVVTATQLQRARDENATKLLAKVKNQRVNLAQAFAEREQAVSLVRDTAKALFSAYSSLKRGDLAGAAESVGVYIKRRSRGARNHRRSHAKDQSKAIANGWIRIQYGLLPLISDVYGVAQHLADLEHEHQYIVVKQVTEREFSDQTVAQTYPGISKSVGTLKFTVKRQVTFRVTGGFIHNFSKLGLTNPATVAWELMPFSFVVDWFLPIGSAINALDAEVGVDFMSGCHTEITEGLFTTETWSSTSSLVQDVETKNSYYTVASRKEFNLSRSVLYDFPAVPTPSFKDPTSVTHSLNALALLIQKLK